MVSEPGVEGLARGLRWRTRVRVRRRRIVKFSSLLRDPSGRELRLNLREPNLWVSCGPKGTILSLVHLDIAVCVPVVLVL